MKKCSFIILLLIAGFISKAQIQRTTTKHSKDSSAVKSAPVENKESRKEIFKQLDLSKEQKMKIKELNQSMNASKEAIENDSTLSGPDKKAKIKTMRKENAQKIQALLTEEQRAKFSELKAKNDVK